MLSGGLPLSGPALSFLGPSQKKEYAPWEARTPDLEVNSLTLWPAELRKQLMLATAATLCDQRMALRARRREKVEGQLLSLLFLMSRHHDAPERRLLYCPQRHDAPWEARTPDLEVNSLTLWPTELRKQMMCSEDIGV